MSIKFLILGGGGVFWVLGGGGSADFIFMGARIFLSGVWYLFPSSTSDVDRPIGRPEPHRFVD